ncbi:MAG: ATP-binding protein involved in chromosome partitioning, partial [Candidatus Omnitrophota bacterium]
MPTVSGIIKILKQIKSSPTSTDIVTSNIAQNIRVEDNSIEFDIALPEHMRETAQLYAQSAKKLIKEKGPDFDIKINIKLLKSQVMPESEKLLHNLKKVRHIIAISSCKGGVGKSTVAANVAQELAQQGHKVGLIDADIYGPSIPTLFNLQSVKVQTKNDSFVPIEKNNLKLMSFGFLLGDQAAVMRGPIVTRYVQQMLLGTEWGELDYLLIDMPPGTGDVHLTITQTINLSGAV